MGLNLENFYLSLGVIGIIVILGFALGKLKLISEGTNKQLINLLLSVFMPASLFMAFPSEYSPNLLNLFFSGLLAGFVVMVSLIAVSRLVFNRMLFKKGLASTAQFAFIFNNATFLGYPIISATFGEEGVVPYCGFIIAFNLALFSYGVWLFEKRLSKRFFKETLTNPNIIAVIFGMMVFLLQVEIPGTLTSSLKYISGATTPLSLICIGFMLSRAKIKETIKKWRLFIIALVQLLIAPIVTFFLLKLLRFPDEVITICTLIQALPTATSLGLFAEKYGGNIDEASELVVISTLSSIVTLPFIVAILFS